MNSSSNLPKLYFQLTFTHKGKVMEGKREEQHLVVVCFTTVSNCLSYNHTPLPSPPHSLPFHSLTPTDFFCLLALKLLVRESDSSACVSVLFLFLFQFLFRFVSSILLPSLFVFNSRKEIAIDKKKCFMVLAVRKFTAFGFAQMLNALQRLCKCGLDIVEMWKSVATIG